MLPLLICYIWLTFVYIRHFTKLYICVILLKEDEYLKKIKLVQLGLFKLEGVPHTFMEIHVIFK